MKLDAHVVARMKSDRFPGKSLALLHGAPIIVHIINKLKRIRDTRPVLKDIIVYIPDTIEDDILEQTVLAQGVKVSRGPELDMLERTYKCYEENNTTHALKIFGDSVFFDSNMATSAIDAVVENEYADIYRMPLFHVKNYDPGIGSICLSRSYIDKSKKLYHSLPKETRIEHQEAFWTGIDKNYDIEEVYDIIEYSLPPDYKLSSTPINLCIDYPLQLVIMNEICNYLGRIPVDHKEITMCYRTIDSIEKLRRPQ